MGSLKRFNLKRIQTKYKAFYLFETGTWKGDSIAYALNYPFKKLYSTEIIEEIAETAKLRFKNNANVEIITNNSIDGLKTKVTEIKGNCIFWLDAHFPGAEEGLKNYNEITNEKIKLPLHEEIEIVASRKHKYEDVILIDDLRIYEDGPFQSGNMPEKILKPEIRNINFIDENFAESHVIIKSYVNEGYILILPKNKYYENTTVDYFHKIFNLIFKKIY